MSKKSSVQVIVTVTGDGISETYAPAPTVNPIGAPGAGPFLKTLTAGIQAHLAAPSALANGLCVTTALTDLKLLSFNDVGSIAIPLGAGTSYLTLPVPTAGLDLVSNAGGDVYLQWT